MLFLIILFMSIVVLHIMIVIVDFKYVMLCYVTASLNASLVSCEFENPDKIL